jgi:hypothetical protein
MSETKTAYAILGGVAVTIYGVPRLTFDVDVNIVLSKDKLTEFFKRAHRIGFIPTVRSGIKLAKTAGVIPMKVKNGAPFKNCDFIIAENILEKLCVKRALTKNIRSSRIRIVTPEDLILHKLLSDRPRDIEDARGILLRQKRLDRAYIRTWLREVSKLSKRKGLVEVFDSLAKV